MIDQDSKLVATDVVFPRNHEWIEFDEEWLAEGVAALGRNLKLGIHLKKTYSYYGLLGFSPILEDDDPSISKHGRTERLNGLAFEYLKNFKKLVDFSPDQARSEMKSWDNIDNNIYALFYIWAASMPKLLDAKEAGNILVNLRDEVFWGEHHQRDLLFAMKERWSSFPLDITRSLEKRLLEGRPKRHKKEDEDFTKRRAWLILNRLQWLSDNGCKLNLDLDVIIAKLQLTVPNWDMKSAKSADMSLESRGGWVRTEKNYDALLNIPVDQILVKAFELKGRDSDFLVEDNPFLGLCEEKPVRAFSALKLRAREGEFPEWAWASFLSRPNVKEDSERLICSTQEILNLASTNQLLELKYSVNRWVEQTFGKTDVREGAPENILLQKLIQTIHEEPKAISSGIVRGNKSADWTNEAINAPAGQLAEAIFSDPAIKKVESADEIPDHWMERAEELLRLPEDAGRYSLVVFMLRLGWFYQVMPNWTKEKLLSAHESKNKDTVNAFWEGIVYGLNNSPSNALLIEIKPLLLLKVTDLEHLELTNANKLISIILISWLRGLTSDSGEITSSDEMRNVLLNVSDRHRCYVLWQLGVWADSKDGGTLNWGNIILDFISNAWPKQTSISTSTVTSSLVSLSLKLRNNFENFAELILPLLGELSPDDHMSVFYDISDNDLVNEHPHTFLKLFDKALPTDTSRWPWFIDEVLTKLGENREIAMSPSYQSLVSRWASR